MSVRKRTWKTSGGTEKQAWVVDYFDQAGKRHLKTFEKKKDADKYEARATVEVGEGTHTAESASITVRQAGEKWLDSCVQNGLEASTIAAYKQHLRLHINPYLGRVKLSQITRPVIRQFEDSLRQGAPAPGDDVGNARSPAMTKKILRSLGSLLGDAVERGLVARNAARDMRSNRARGKERQAEKRQKGKLVAGVDIPTRQEVKAIVEAAQGRWRPVLLTAIFTGLRASELRGLRWVDVDLEKRELHVRQRADRYGAIGAPKSHSGVRTVPLPPMVVNTLREWKLACPKGELGLIFPTSTGRITDHKSLVDRALAPVQMTAGVTVTAKAKDGAEAVRAKYTGLHALRHFYASWCINRRADGGLELPAKVVQERLGHSSILMTMDTYGHLFPAADHRAELEAAERSLLG
jgi:integrase